ncbi:hypothetical protein, partial [Bacillus amyloliquefaciens]|uniref:hypothetical protein n=1 Tax=Bacillus amyloliquefaciens TaxID=1390 RepID=UPI001F0D727A
SAALWKKLIDATHLRRVVGEYGPMPSRGSEAASARYAAPVSAAAGKAMSSFAAHQRANRFQSERYARVVVEACD